VLQDVSLSDRLDLAKSPVLLTGTQALVRLMLAQQARDRAARHRTAGYVTGYRGSPLGGVDVAMTRAAGVLGAADIRFQAGLNEDLAATACWGTQSAGLRGQGRFDGVFALWYGKGPGVDRSGDVMRHANMAGTAPLGGVIMALGDDHTGESSTCLHQSDFACVDASMPVLSPAGVQEILDLGLYGFALSRFTGLWAGLKLMKDTVETAAVVDGRADRMAFVTPDVTLPDGGLNIRLTDDPVAQEARVALWKRPAAVAFARANRVDRRGIGAPGATIGLVAAGKSWLDVVQALGLLGIDDDQARHLGLTAWKVAQTWPMDTESLTDWAQGLRLVVVVEEKRKLIEGQVRDALYHAPDRPRVWGARKGGPGAEPLFAEHYALDPVDIALKLGAILLDEGRATDAIRARMEHLRTAQAALPPDQAARTAYFCAGCPHSTSTRVPDGSRAYAGIGCHYLAQFMDRDTQGFTQMGGEGANWVGEAPFVTTPHVFQNIGDGTYNHSGAQAIRAAVAAGVNVTFKVLFNDAVAMTGGQGNDGGLTPWQIAHELVALRLAEVAVVHDEKEPQDPSLYPPGLAIRPRADLDAVQRRLRDVPGVTAIVYVQTCAAEKRRRRKKGAFPDPDRRVWINPDVCEGCGDCGVQSNCVAIVPVDTPLGRKRAIDQSACNKDFSCLKGFCPSFVTVEGGRPRKSAAQGVDTAGLPEPDLPAIRSTWNAVIAGVGGTGVVTLGAILAQAAQIEGKGAAMVEMTGIAQKGGAVHIHVRIAERPADIAAVRLAAGEADALIGGDLVVSAGGKTLALTAPGRTAGVVNSHQVMTGAFTRDADFRLPGAGMTRAITGRLGQAAHLFDATRLAEVALGDAIYSNMVVLGAAWQRGLIPLSHAAIARAVTLNGQAVKANLAAFDLGRWAVVHPTQAAAMGAAEVPEDRPETILAALEAHLVAYQSPRLARRWRRLWEQADDPRLRLAIARGYHKVLAYKDEYEVARLHLDTKSKLANAFDGDLRVTYHLAPPGLSRPGPDGRPAKRAFGPWIERAFRVLAPMKRLRGTPFDPFGYARERRAERAAIRAYEADMAHLLATACPATMDAAVALAELPLSVRGFGPVKAAAATRAAARRAESLAALAADPAPLARAAE
jgi:indolepyruvate ferredoxin oxidoreductase